MKAHIADNAQRLQCPRCPKLYKGVKEYYRHWATAKDQLHPGGQALEPIARDMEPPACSRAWKRGQYLKRVDFLAKPRTGPNVKHTPRKSKSTVSSASSVKEKSQDVVIVEEDKDETQNAVRSIMGGSSVRSESSDRASGKESAEEESESEMETECMDQSAATGKEADKLFLDVPDQVNPTGDTTRKEVDKFFPDDQENLTGDVNSEEARGKDEGGPQPKRRSLWQKQYEVLKEAREFEEAVVACRGKYMGVARKRSERKAALDGLKQQLRYCREERQEAQQIFEEAYQRLKAAQAGVTDAEAAVVAGEQELESFQDRQVELVGQLDPQ